MDWLSIFLSTPGFIPGLGYMNTAIDAVYGYVGGCLQGTCPAFPDTYISYLQGIAGDTIGWFSGAPAVAIYGIFKLMPDGGGLPSQIHDAAIFFGNTLSSVSWMLPVSALIQCLSLIIAVKLLLWTFYLSKSVLAFVRGIPVEKYSWFS